MKKHCFFIARIGEKGSPECIRSDKVLERLLNPVLENLGYDPALRADHMATAGVITRQIMQELLDADLVVADLTGDDATVFYELAIRHISSKPFVQVAHTGHQLPFDLAQQHTVLYNFDVDAIQACREHLQKAITAAEIGSRTDTEGAQANHNWYGCKAKSPTRPNTH